MGSIKKYDLEEEINSMRLAFCIFQYFPFGGLQRDFFRIASECVRRGHHVDIYVADWQGDTLKGAAITVIPIAAMTNHQSMMAYAKQVGKILKKTKYDVVIGFNKMPELNIYFAGDVCLKARLTKERKFLRGILQRYRQYLWLERAVFEEKSKTKIFVLTEQQIDDYRTFYQTSKDRFVLLPPGIAQNRLSSKEMLSIRIEYRDRLLEEEDIFLFLFVASHFQTKGLDRAIRALASLKDDRSSLLVIGGDRLSSFRRLARHLNVERRVKFIGAQDELSNYFLAADTLVHPSRVDSAGMVLLEALSFGLPIITTDVCGYAFHVNRAQAGAVLLSPFDQQILNEALADMLDGEKCYTWRDNALNYASDTDLYSLVKTAVNFIEAV